MLSVGSADVPVVASVRDLGVQLDCNLNMHLQVSKICKTSCYHLRNIRHIRPYLTDSAAASLVHAFITSQIDYCNSLLYGLPKSVIEKLQRIQNCAVRILLRLRKYDHITPGLHQLHWLPVRYRIHFKICLITFKCLHNLAPSYLSDMLQIKERGRYELRSRHRPVLLDKPRYKCETFGGRSFRVAAPELWNSLPDNIRGLNNIELFKKHLKSHFFQLFVNESAS